MKDLIKNILNNFLIKEEQQSKIGEWQNNLKKYKKLSYGFRYLEDNNETSFIIVKKLNDKFIILDGLHRASLVKFNGQKKLVVLEIL